MVRLKELQLYIIRSLAVFNTPTEVAKDIKEIYGIELKPQNIEAYDPTKRAGINLREELKNVLSSAIDSSGHSITMNCCNDVEISIRIF